MKVFVVLFGVEYEGEMIDGVFSCQEMADSQVEESKKLHGGYRVKRGEQWVWSKDNDQWEIGDYYIRIKEFKLDEYRKAQ